MGGSRITGGSFCCELLLLSVLLLLVCSSFDGLEVTKRRLQSVQGVSLDRNASLEPIRSCRRCTANIIVIVDFVDGWLWWVWFGSCLIRTCQIFRGVWFPFMTSYDWLSHDVKDFIMPPSCFVRQEDQFLRPSKEEPHLCINHSANENIANFDPLYCVYHCDY